MVIKTKYNVGDECYFVYHEGQSQPFLVKIGRIIFDSERNYDKITYDSDFNDDDERFNRYSAMSENDLFATKEDAEKKLKEMKGK